MHFFAVLVADFSISIRRKVYMDVSTKLLSNFKTKYLDNNALVAAWTFLHF